MTTAIFRPNSDVLVEQDKSNPSVPAYSLVDEAVLDTSDDCATDDGVYKLNLYGLPNHTSEDGLISSVKVSAVCERSSLFRSSKVKLAIKTDGTVYYGSQQVISADPTTYSTTWSTNPKTGTAWTWSDIDSLVAGCAMNSGSTRYKCWNYQLWVEVTYTAAVAPTVTTSGSYSSYPTSVTVSGSITDTGGSEHVYRRGFVYMQGTEGTPVVGVNSVVYEDGNFGVGTFLLSITGLNPLTSYRVRAYAVNSAGVGYGSATTVTTLQDVPTVVTNSPTQVTTTSATLNGTVSSTGGSTVTRRGFCYIQGTSGTPTIDDNVIDEEGTFSSGTYSLSLEGLTPNTSYRIVAFAENSYGIAYGSVVDLATMSVGFFLFM